MCRDSATMDKIFLCVLLVVVTVEGVRKHPKFPKFVEDMAPVEVDRVVCSRDHEIKRDDIIEKASCGPPKDVFIALKPPSKTKEVTPGAIWIKRCVGLCDLASGANCIPIETRIIQVPVRIYDEVTDKESCAVYPVEEHVKCKCCELSAERCGTYKLFNARKCACQCPYPEERRRCLRKRNMKWNRSKCTCEVKMILGHGPVL